MAKPTWLAYGLALLMLSVSLYCVARMMAARWWHRRNHGDVNIAHMANGVAMVGMLVPAVNWVPDALWECVFVALALWFARKSVVALGAARGRQALSHNLIHVVLALAMLYMYLAAVPTDVLDGGTSAPAMSGPTGVAVNFGALPLLFVVVLLVSAVWQLDGLSAYRRVPGVLVGAATGSGFTAAGSSRRAPVALGEPPRPLEPANSDGRWLAPRLEMGCHIAMCITMAYLLVLML